MQSIALGQSHTIPVEKIAGMRLQPETRWLQPLTKLWVDAETGPIAVTSPNADALQVATL